MNDAAAGRTAGFVSRFVAMTVDVLIIVVAEAATVGFIAALRSVFPSFVPQFLVTHRVVVGSIVSVLFILVYFVGFWTLFGRTPGKMLMGLQVIGTSGDPPRLGRSIVRFLGYIVSTIPVYLGFFWVLGEHRMGWHDHLAATRVVYVPGPRNVVGAGAGAASSGSQMSSSKA